MSTTMNWKEPETKIKLFLAILAANEATVTASSKASEIAKYIGCTPKAVTHQLTALRKEVDELKNIGVAGMGTPSTPVKKGSKKTGAKRERDDDGDAEDGEKPEKVSKKGKKDAGANGTKAKKVEVKKDETDGELGGVDGEEDKAQE